MRFTRQELDSQRGREVPDLVDESTRLLFVGINPGLWTAAVQAHFARPGNRFYPALFRAGITDRVIDASSGYRPEDLEHLHSRAVGITNIVPIATARADELTADELRAGALALGERIARIRPRAVAVLGVTAYRTAFGARRAATGRQPDSIAGVPTFVAPNPSGLNAHDTVDSLAAAYRAIAVAAGIAVYPRDGLPAAG